MTTHPATLQFKAEILINGVNPYVLVTRERAELLCAEWRKPMPVVIQVDRQPVEPWHINMMPMGNGDFYLYLHADVRKASGTKVGDTVLVEMSFDNAYTAGPEPLPIWFKQALLTSKAALDNWNRLSPSRQKEVVRSLTRLQSPAAKTKNLQQIIYVLSGKDGQYMGRSWSKGA